MRFDKRANDKFNSIRKLFNLVVIIIINDSQRIRFYDANVTYEFCVTILRMNASHLKISNAKNVNYVRTTITIANEILRRRNFKTSFAH